jgi:hypothetical protein
MPNIWAHIQFGKEVLNGIQEQNRLDNTEWKNAFQLGCQGPDFLFYDNFLPWQYSTPLNQLGSLMHNVHCGPFLVSLFDEVRQLRLDKPEVAYTIGFLLHHMLDRHLHPFVFSRSGFKKWYHQRFETAMDSIILSERAGLHTGTTPVALEIYTGGRLPGGFAARFLRVVSNHYPVIAAWITAEQLDKAVAQFHRAQRLFFDPTGWKSRLTFGQLEPFSPPRRLPDWDVLNETHQPWVDPTDRTLIYTISAMELWDLALQDARETTIACFAWLTAETDEQVVTAKMRFMAYLQDLSYETGRPCGSTWITYADSVVPK